MAHALPRPGPVSRFLDRVYPWPNRAERRAEIAEARADRHRAEGRLARARAAEAELQSIVYSRNHLAELVASTLGLSPEQFYEVMRSRHSPKGGM
jgi:hypothetical protein